MQNGTEQSRHTRLSPNPASLHGQPLRVTASQLSDWQRGKLKFLPWTETNLKAT